MESDSAAERAEELARAAARPSEERPDWEAEARHLLADPPKDDKELLELWALPGDESTDEETVEFVDHLRFFVLTWDPLEWVPGRNGPWITTNGQGDDRETVAYVLLDALGPDRLESARRMMTDLIEASLRRPVPLRLGSMWPDWEPIGLGAIQDLAQDAYGPVDLDRSRVSFGPCPARDPICPACAGESFGFPAELEDASTSMCPQHYDAARQVTESRLERARESNPEGWRAIGKASARLHGLPEPHAPVPGDVVGAHTGRNDPCPCGSGKKFKHCHGAA